MANTDRFSKGVRIADYLIERQLGAEPVYEATHTVLPRRVRLEILHPRCAGLRPVAVRLMREACLVEGLRHPGVPRIYDVGLLADQRPWVASEWVEGEVLGVSLAAGPLPVAEVAQLLRDAAEVLAHAHRCGIVHRNLSAEVIVRRDGRRGFPLCVTGWSEAKVDTDHAIDIAGLGIVAYQALTGEFPSQSAARRCPQAPARLTWLIDEMLSPDSTARPSATAVAALARLLFDQLDAAWEDELVDEEVLELPDHSDEVQAIPPPLPRRAGRWTPPHGLSGPATPRPGLRIGILKRRT